MGSQSDYSVMKECEKILKILKVKFQVLIVSAHRTPKRMFQFAENAEKNGFGVIIAGAGGAAHLAGMVASLTTLPVLGVPIETKKLKGLDSLLSMVQMPKGVPIGCLAIDGAFNAGVLAASIIGNYDENFYYAQDYKLFFDLLKYNYNFKAILKPHYILNVKNNISENKRIEQNYFAECVRKKITPSKYLKG